MDIANSLWTNNPDKTLEIVLAELGWPAPPRTRRLFESLASGPDEKAAFLVIADDIASDLMDSADPLRALLNLSHLRDAFADGTDLWRKFTADAGLRARTCVLLAFSQAISDTLIREPYLLDEIVASPRFKSRAEMRAEAYRIADSACEVTSRGVAADALRAFRRRETLRIALLDLDSATWRDADDFNVVVRSISDLATVCISAALRILAPRGAPFAVFGMGKLGARELNYSSDVDLIFVHDGDNAAMVELGTELLKILGASTAQGTLFRVDMRLRPDGKSGALVTPIGYALSYYESFAMPWEWQAMIKCRAVAGDAQLGRRFRRFVRTVTWARRPDDSHLGDMLAMKRRMELTPEGKDVENVKQGPGGIRDAEWFVQQLQMMVGPAHPRVRAKATLRAFELLQQFDALTLEEERRSRQGYLFLRVLEHRLQLLDEQAVRILPKSPAERAALARRLGCTARGPAAARWLEEELAHHRAQIRAICDRLFWGWSDVEHEVDFASSFPADSARRLERIASGTTSQPFPAPLARQNRIALSALIGYLEHAADSERAIVNLEQLCDISGNRLSLLRALGASPELSRAVFAILGGSSRLTDTIVRFPELLDLAAQRSLLKLPRSQPEAISECKDYCYSFKDKTAALRRWKSRELLRIGLRDLVLDAQAPEITAEIANLAQACLTIACDEVGRRRRPGSESIAFSVLGMGKLGGGEMHYNSDPDVIFAYDDFASRDDQVARGARANEAAAWAADFMKLLGERTEDGVCFEVDARLRPDGRNGPLVRTVSGFLEYFERPSGGLAVWERQALTRARYIAGDPGTAARLRAAIAHVAYPAEWDPAWGDELRRIKSRVENERAAHGTGSGTVFDVKLGPGCLSDIEFCAQWLAMKNGHAFADLQTPNTLRQLAAAGTHGLLKNDDAEAIAAAYTFFRRAELRLQITHEHSVKAVKRQSREFVTWARTVYPEHQEPEAHFAAEWHEHAARARAIMERVRDAL